LEISPDSETQSDTSTPTSDKKGDIIVMSNPCDQLLDEVQTRVSAAKLKGQSMFKPCLVITTKAIYILKLHVDPVSAFLELATANHVREAERIATCFDLEVKGLFELAADVRLSKKDFAGIFSFFLQNFFLCKN
jgi:hypothetical protein